MFQTSWYILIFVIVSIHIRYSSCSQSSAEPRCLDDIKLAVYPSDIVQLGINNVTSVGFRHLLDIVKSSVYYTFDLSEACLFLLNFDTLDRDILSQNYFRNLNKALGFVNQTLWNQGAGHIVFNQFAGTYPYYDETALDFDYGHAILAKSSFSESHYRQGYDIAFPLFDWNKIPTFMPPQRSAEKGCGAQSVSGFREFRLVFKGKRYVYGLGSRTRDRLFHLNDGDGSVVLVTCKHGKDWEQFQDERCDQDNFAYERFPWQYPEMLANSAYCLVPRGRRLDSYRFLEALSAGCVPVILSDGWVLPFSDVINWDRIVLRVPEHRTFQIRRTVIPEVLKFQVPHVIRNLSFDEWRERSELGCRIYQNYFSSAEQIVLTALLILNQRYSGRPELKVQPDAWMDSPLGALSFDASYQGVLPVNGCPNAEEPIDCLVVLLDGVEQPESASTGCKTVQVLDENFGSSFALAQRVTRSSATAVLVVNAQNAGKVDMDLLLDEWKRNCLSITMSTNEKTERHTIDSGNFGGALVLHRYLVHHMLSRGRRDVSVALAAAPASCFVHFVHQHAMRWFRTEPVLVRLGVVGETQNLTGVNCSELAETAFLL